MKFLLLLLLFVPISINAEMKSASKELSCDSMDKVISELHDEYGETLLVIGRTSAGSIVINTFNPKTATWTVIEITDKLACVLAVGQGIEINSEFFNKQKTERWNKDV